MQVEPAGRRLRAFNLFLKRNPDYAAPDLEELTEPPLWATRAVPLRLLAHPDLLDGAINEALIEPSMSNLAKQTVRALLRVVQSPEERFARSGVLKTFIDGYRIGRTKGAALLFDANDKARIRALLSAEGIDPDTDPAAWDGIGRAEALHLGPDEKFASAPVKRQRVAIKTLPGRPLNLDGQALILPPACHLDAEGPAVGGLLAHETVLLVENWESFNRIHDTSLDLAPAGENPLVVWLGDRSDTRADHALGLLRALDVPVWAFVDYDPAGLLIAAGLPRLAGIIAPEPERLERDLALGPSGTVRGPASHGRCGVGCQYERAGAKALDDPPPPWAGVAAGALSDRSLCANCR